MDCLTLDAVEPSEVLFDEFGGDFEVASFGVLLVQQDIFCNDDLLGALRYERHMDAFLFEFGIRDQIMFP